MENYKEHKNLFLVLGILYCWQGKKLEFLTNSSRENSYSLQQIQRVLSRKEKTPQV
jgi:hypothetical protein